MKSAAEFLPIFPPGRRPVRSSHGAVATSHPLASAEALTVLQNGGSAADAAVAAAGVLCVAEPHMTGVGGDAFALARPPDGGGGGIDESNPIALDGSGWLPAGFSLPGPGPDSDPGPNGSGLSKIPETSPLAVTVPGAVAAWEKLHRRFGRLPWREVLAPAIRCAREGVPVAPRVARDWRREIARVESDPDAKKLFLKDGKSFEAGEIFSNPRLAESLEEIAQGGAKAFYCGGAARDIVAKLNALGGAHAAADFADFHADGARWRAAAAADYRGWTVWECPPSGQGLAALLMLRAMAARDFAKMNPARRVAAFAEICARAYEWRDAAVGDDSPRGDFSRILESALREKFPAEKNSAEKFPTEKIPAEHRDTICLAAADSSGLAVSFINSLFHPFGGGIVAPQSGILLHNRGAAFSPSSAVNAPGPRKRPLHTIIPGMARSPHGDILSFGVMGGNYQAAGHAWLLMNLLDCGMDLQAALDAPRIFAPSPQNRRAQVEPGFSESERSALAEAGWNLVDSSEPLGGGQAVLRFADGTFLSASDSRKDGVALGF